MRHAFDGKGKRIHACRRCSFTTPRGEDLEAAARRAERERKRQLRAERAEARRARLDDEHDRRAGVALARVLVRQAERVIPTATRPKRTELAPRGPRQAPAQSKLEGGIEA